MANLKGGSFDRQIKDMNMRLSSIGQSKHHATTEHQTHSFALEDKRHQYQREFISHLESKNITDGKLNQLMTDTKVKDFLNEQTSKLSPTSSINYMRGFSSMMQGLEERNIAVPCQTEVIDLLVSQAKEEQTMLNEPIEKKSFDDVNNANSKLYDKSFSMGVLGEIQRETGLRVSEAIKLMREPEKYINNEKITGMIGKGKHEYIEKDISRSLINKIYAVENIPSKSSFDRAIKEIEPTKSSHSFRFNYAREQWENGMSKADISENLGHHRESMTDYYLARS